MATMRSPKNFWAGLLYVGVGLAAVVIARGYGMGTGSRMGPAYFPTMLGSLLALVGAASIVRAFVVPGEPVGAIGWKAILFVTGGTALFALLLRPAGLIPAVAALLLVSAAGSTRFRVEPRAFALAALLVAFCALVFVKGLGLPVSLIGPR